MNISLPINKKYYLLISFLFLILVSTPSFSQTILSGNIVHAKEQDVVGCKTPDTLRELKKQMNGIVLPEGWQDRIQNLGCYPVAPDLNWRVASIEQDVMRLQLAMPSVPMPVLWFSSDDIRPGPGAP